MADADTALRQATAAAALAGVPALQAEVDAAAALPAQVAARLWQPGGAAPQPLTLAEVATRLASGALVVDAGRHGLHASGRWWPLARRPLLFTLLQALAEGWPGDVARGTLIARAFRTRDPDDSHRARLRVEIGRLRALAAPVLAITATPRGFALRPAGDRGDRGEEPLLLLPPLAGAHGALQALLADGAAWSTSALALALGESQRNVQRALAALQDAGRVRAIGRGRTQRWLAPPLTGASAAFTTILLLPSALPDA
jgi:DNA-binding transcriptional ArsR family regulator